MQPPKLIITDQQARTRLKAGVDKLADVVKSTLGPGGSNVILDYNGLYGITKDGVSVASMIYLEDVVENIGAQVVKEAASKTAREAGDGTTTATVLAQAIFAAGIKNITAGAKPLDIKRGIDMAVALIVPEIKKLSVPVKTQEDIQAIANISSNGDSEISYLITAAIDKVGKDGLVFVEDAKALKSDWKVVDGMQFDRGYMSGHFVTDEHRAEVLFDKPIVLIYDGAIAKMRELVPLLKIAQDHPDLKGHQILLIAEDYTKELVDTLAYNKIKAGLQICAVQAPDFQDVRKEVMKDIAALTGATVITKEAGLTLENATAEVYGSADKIRVTAWQTTIMGGHGAEERTARENVIREQMKSTNDHALEVLKQRLARLTNGVAVIYVGGASDVEIREKKDRIDDALHATRAAIEEGIVQGGGMAYLLAFEGVRWPEESNEDVSIGMEILFNSIEVPIKTIAENVGVSGDVVLAGVREKNLGYNARTKKYENLIAAGIVDPTKVVRLALENAASVAGMLLTTNAIVAIKPKDEEKR